MLTARKPPSRLVMVALLASLLVENIYNVIQEGLGVGEGAVSEGHFADGGEYAGSGVGCHVVPEGVVVEVRVGEDEGEPVGLCGVVLDE